MASAAKNPKTNKDVNKKALKPVENVERVELKNTFWKSTLFNDIYLDQDIYRQHPEMWDIDGDPEFESCMNGLLNLFSDWNEDQLSGWTEADTVAHWIKPILVCLGWVDDGKTALPHSDQAAFAVRDGERLQTYFADILISDTVDDMSLYVDKKLTAEQRLEKAKGKVLIPLEAKYWNRINKQYAGKLSKKEEKEKNSKNVDAANRLGPNGQTLKYMEILNLEWGILSDGATWRLFNKDLSSESEGRYLEFNIYNLYKRSQMALDNEGDSEIFREATKFFYNFFSKKALFPKEKKKELVRNALNESKSYSQEVEEDLKLRFLNAMNIVCNGLKRSAGKSEDKNTIRTVAESHLFNILFIKSCEARNILPLNAPKYWDISLSRMIDALHCFDPGDFETSKKSVEKDLKASFHWFNYSGDGFELYENLISLSKLIHNGTNGKGKGFYIDGFMESVFNKQEWAFANENKLTNTEMIKTLFELGFATAPKKSKRIYQEIPYQFFTPRQLGSIYESFLEYSIDTADSDMAYVKKEWKPANLSSEKVKKMNVPKVKKGQLYFFPDNVDRKATGSYYTPEYIVKFIVEETLSPICKGLSSDEILELNVCDPAMGSGHFLNGVLNYLTEKYLEALEGEILDDINLTPEEAKRIVLDKCIYGVDINFRAVKLACMSLWLESAHKGKKLERLDDQLISRNSLADQEVKKAYIKNSINLNWKPFVLENDFPKVKGGFNAIVGNPPYGAKLTKETQKILNERFNLGTTDTAALFLKLSYDLVNEKGRIGYILPKSLTYSSTWKETRELLKPHISLIGDVSKVWKDVKLEQVITIINCSKKSNHYESVTRKGEKLINVGNLSKEVLSEFGIFLNSVSQEELDLARLLKSKSTSINKICNSNDRGGALQSSCNSSRSNNPVYGGKELGLFSLGKENKYIKKSDITKSNAHVLENTVLAQNLVAHIQNPTDHLQIISAPSDAFPKEAIILDTINQLKLKSSFCPYFVSGLLSSHITNWFTYRFLVGKAIRTIHFDASITNRVIFPNELLLQKNKKLVSRVSSIVKKSLALGEKYKVSELSESLYEIDNLIYEIYGLSKKDIALLESSNPRAIKLSSEKQKSA